MMDYDVVIEKRIITTNPDRKHALGRHVNHDSRSRNYAFKAPEKVQLGSVLHNRNSPILDQGQLGSCTGNAAVGVLGSDPHGALPGKPTLNESLAVEIYSEATVIDGAPGQYPPDDTGSDGLSVAKISLKKLYISGYQHTFTFNDALAALMQYPLMTGVNWYSSFDYPDSSGYISLSSYAQVEGGHEFEIVGMDYPNKLIYAVNSWGTSWGKNGTFNFSFDTWERLLSEQGDVTLLLPLSVPAPTPTPIPVPDPNNSAVDDAFAIVAQNWLNSKPWFYRKSIQASMKKWLASR